MSELKDYVKVHRVGHKSTNGIFADGELVIREKLDGANFRFGVDVNNDRLLFGSKNVVYKNEKDIDKNFRHAVEYVRDHVDPNDVQQMVDAGVCGLGKHGCDDLTFFGEAMHKHTLEYGDTHNQQHGWDDLPSFIGFDIYSHIEDYWFGPRVVDRIYEELGLPTAPIVDRIDAGDFEDEYGFNFVPESEYRDGGAEGIVMTNSNTGVKAKLVSEQFAEKHGSAKGGGHSPNGLDTHELLQTYCTEARIRKHIHKLQDRGHDLDRSMMSELPVAVAEDIVEEEAHEIVTSNWTIDFKDLRSEVASGNHNPDCLSTIDAMMTKRVSTDNDGNSAVAVAEGGNG